MRYAPLTHRTTWQKKDGNKDKAAKGKEKEDQGQKQGGEQFSFPKTVGVNTESDGNTASLNVLHLPSSGRRDARILG